MTTRRRTAIYLERGVKRTFACAVEWPGWSRSGRGPDEALETLAAYSRRYARVGARAGLDVPRGDASAFDVVETVAGTATTDFGAPSVVAGVDTTPLSARDRARMVALLEAAWDELRIVAAGAPASLRKGPRGGGRDRDAMLEHVIDSERAYARHIGVRISAAEWKHGGESLLRERVAEVMRANPDAEHRWPPRYVARRMAWHALDHAWEIEDRSVS